MRIVPDVRVGPTDSWLGPGAGSHPVTGPALPRWSKALFKATVFGGGLRPCCTRPRG